MAKILIHLEDTEAGAVALQCHHDLDKPIAELTNAEGVAKAMLGELFETLERVGSVPICDDEPECGYDN